MADGLRRCRQVTGPGRRACGRQSLRHFGSLLVNVAYGSDNYNASILAVWALARCLPLVEVEHTFDRCNEAPMVGCCLLRNPAGPKDRAGVGPVAQWRSFQELRRRRDDVNGCAGTGVLVAVVAG